MKINLSKEYVIIETSGKIKLGFGNAKSSGLDILIDFDISEQVKFEKNSVPFVVNRVGEYEVKGVLFTAIRTSDGTLGLILEDDSMSILIIKSENELKLLPEVSEEFPTISAVIVIGDYSLNSISDAISKLETTYIIATSKSEDEDLAFSKKLGYAKLDDTSVFTLKPGLITETEQIVFLK